MKALACEELNGVVTLTVRRWRWFHFVTETWLSDTQPGLCQSLIAHPLDPTAEHRIWDRDANHTAGCQLSMRLDALLDNVRRVQRMQHRVEQVYDNVIDLDASRRAK